MKKMQFDKTMEEVRHDLKTRDDVIVIDVREEDEYEAGHIPGALCYPLHTLENHIQELSHMAKEIYVYCHSGQRSTAACNLLKAYDIPNVFNVGGIIHWSYATKGGKDAGSL